MISLPKKPVRRRSFDDDMIPMINIVFLLLIFFMIAGQILPREQGLQPPASTSEQALAPGEVEISLDAQGRLNLNGDPLDGPLLEALRGRGVAAETLVVCRAHKSLPASALDPVLAAVRALGVGRLQIVTESRS